MKKYKSLTVVVFTSFLQERKKTLNYIGGELQSDVYENLTEFCQISLKILPYLTDLGPQLMACMHIWFAELRKK